MHPRSEEVLFCETIQKYILKHKGKDRGRERECEKSSQKEQKVHNERGKGEKEGVLESQR